MKYVIFKYRTQALDDDGDSGGGGGGGGGGSSGDGWGEEMISGAVSSLPKATNEDVATPPCDSWRVISGRLWNSGISLGGLVLGVRGVRKPAKLLLLDIPRHIMSMGRERAYGNCTQSQHNLPFICLSFILSSVPFMLARHTHHARLRTRGDSQCL